MLHLPKRTKRETSTMAMKTEIEVPKSGSESPPPPPPVQGNQLPRHYILGEIFEVPWHFSVYQVGAI